MTAEGAYRPVACDFHDELEAYAVTRRRVRIFHAGDPRPDGALPQGGQAPEARREGLIQDIYTAGSKEEFLRMEDGTIIRLDRISKVEVLT